MKKKILISVAIAPFVLIFLIYIVFISYYKYEEYQVKKLPQLDKALISHLKSEHTLIPLYYGPQSLAKRIQLIEEAKKSIELEFFIYDLDLASQIITKKLIQKASEGIKVRILVDFSLAVFKLKPIYGYFLKQKGIEVKYYNTSGIDDIIGVQHRSHRKLLIVDNEKVITGGRNISNDYFNLSSHYNFLDSDIYIEGEIVAKMRESFDLYWNSDLSLKSEISEEVTKEELDLASQFANISKEDLLLFEQVEALKEKILASENKYICNDITFVTDFPGVSTKNRLVYPHIEKLVGNAQKSIMIETPYFVLRPDGLSLIKSMDQRGLQINVLTNGLFSTDAYYTVSALYPVLDDLAKTNMQLYAYKGEEPELKYPLPVKMSHRWGIHSKRAIIDDDTLLIGTYNVDPRSANLNSELIVVCKGNKELVSYTRENMQKRIDASFKIIENNHANIDRLLEKSDWKQKLKFYFVLPISNLFNFLL